MDEGSSKLEERLDELYREHPGEFVAGRDLLVKELRAAGEHEEAERVKKLRRPSAAAWLLNRVAHEAPAQLQELAEAGGQLEDAQRRALEGEDGATAEWRDAAAREREATTAVVEAAERVAQEAGHPASGRALELVGETLRAASGDAELRTLIVQGRVERERSAATLGTPERARPRKRAPKQAKGRDLAQARRELERLRGELADAESREARSHARVEQATETLREAKAKAKDGRRETAALRRQVKAAERRARSADPDR